MKFRIADHLWTQISPATERELQDALFDLNMDEDGQAPVVELDAASDGGVLVSLSLPDGSLRQHHLSFDYLRDPFRDYREVITKMARADSGFFGMRDIESLDYAKKLVHDEGGKRISKVLVADLGALPLATARRVFTLAFLVAVDLPPELVRRHRRHGP